MKPYEYIVLRALTFVTPYENATDEFNAKWPGHRASAELKDAKIRDQYNARVAVEEKLPTGITASTEDLGSRVGVYLEAAVALRNELESALAVPADAVVRLTYAQYQRMLEWERGDVVNGMEEAP